MKNLITLLLLALLFSCKEKQTKVTLDKTKHLINIDIPVGEVLLTSSLVKKPRTIILEDHVDASIGYLTNMQVCGNYIFVLDASSAKKLLMFDKNGKYIRQIGSEGAGPGEYISIDDFCIDKENKEVYTYDNNALKFNKYDYETGIYINSIILKERGTCNSITYVNKKLYANCMFFESGSKNLLVEIDLETGTQTEYLDIETYNLGCNEPLRFGGYNYFHNKTGNSQRFTQVLMNTVIGIDNTGIHSFLTVQSKNWAQREEIIPIGNSIIKENLFIRLKDVHNKGRFYGIESYAEIGDYIFFTCGGGRKLKSVLYNTKTKEVKSPDYLANDLIFESGGQWMGFNFYNSKTVYQCVGISQLHYFKAVLAADLDKREELLNENDERYVVFEYEFK